MRTYVLTLGVIISTFTFAKNVPVIDENLLASKGTMIRVDPVVPKEVEGVNAWVHLSYDINKRGSVENIEVLDSYPLGLVENAAVTALSKYKYMPLIRDGKLVRENDREILIKLYKDESGFGW